MSLIRHLSLHVDETEPLEFYWIIMERSHDPAVWLELKSAMHAHHTWKQAWVAGTVAYNMRVKDNRLSPRAEGEDENASPVSITP